MTVIDELMNINPSPSTRDGQVLSQLTTLVEEYEKRMGWELSNRN